MRYFIKPMSIKIPQSVIRKAETFAKQVVGTVNYSDSNQSLKSKIKFDHFISKIGEEAVYRAFRLFTNEVTPPDYKIYIEKEKSWVSDLKVDNTQLAVKTQTSSAAKLYGLSWTFQCSEVRRDPILDNPDAWLCFVECDDINEYKCKVFPPCQISDLKFSEPKLAKLKGKKKVIYADCLD